MFEQYKLNFVLFQLMKTIKPHFPQPIDIVEPLHEFDQHSDFVDAVRMIKSGKRVVVVDFYSTGLKLLNALRQDLEKTEASFEEQRRFRAEYQKFSNCILLEIVGQNLAVKKAPKIGWFKVFYPHLHRFYLSFPQVQGLNSSWQWYTKGVHIPVLRNKIHPYYGTYFPTRFEHLILFDNWLKRYRGDKKFAYDIGFGSGVLSLQLVKHGFQKVLATDINPNAVIGLQKYMGTTKLSRKIELDIGHLFGKWTREVELIVFNPPWLPASDEKFENLDAAIYYPPELFVEFFEEASLRLLPEGLLVVIFSNLAEVLGLATSNPVKMELENHRRFELVQKLTRKVKPSSKRTRRDAFWREEEEVELWVLKLNDEIGNVEKSYATVD